MIYIRSLEQMRILAALVVASAARWFCPGSVERRCHARTSRFQVDLLVIAHLQVLPQRSRRARRTGVADQTDDAYVVFDALRQKRVTLTQPVTISEKPARARLAHVSGPGQFRRDEELLHGMIVQSGNDASIAWRKALPAPRKSLASNDREAARPD